MQADDFKCVVTVAQTKNITQAAEKLYMTQPALSRKISSIERNLGVIDPLQCLYKIKTKRLMLKDTYTFYIFRFLLIDIFLHAL